MEEKLIVPEETHHKKQPQKNWWKIFALSFLTVIIAGALIASGFYLGRQKQSMQQGSTYPLTEISPTSSSTSSTETQTPTAQDSGIPITANTVSFARINNKVYLQYKGKIYDQDEQLEPKEIQITNANQYTWYGLVNIDATASIGYNEIFSFKVAPNNDNFVFVMRYEMPTSGDQYDFNIKAYYYDQSKQGNKVTQLFSFIPYNAQLTKYEFSKIDTFSNDSAYVSFTMFSCWNCGGHQPEKLVLNLKTGINKSIGKVSYFAWKDKGKYEYKEYIPQPCPTPTGTPPGEYMQGECPKDPATLPLKSGQI